MESDPNGRPPLRAAVVVRRDEDLAEVLLDGRTEPVRYAPQFPTPRLERVSPGHLLAVTAGPDGQLVALWRWYDAVVVAHTADGVTLWEPAHGEVVATARPTYAPQTAGTRAWASAGLPGAEWWVAGPAVGECDLHAELAAVADLYTGYGLWDVALGRA